MNTYTKRDKHYVDFYFNNFPVERKLKTFIKNIDKIIETYDYGPG